MAVASEPQSTPGRARSAAFLGRPATQHGVKRRGGPADRPFVTETAAETWASSRAVLMICLGISAYVGVLHASLARRGHPANAWVALWAFGTALVQLTRISPVSAADPEHMVTSARLAVAITPVLLGGLTFVVRSLAGRPIARGALTAFVGTTLFFASLAIGTPLFIASAPKLAPGPAMPVVALALAAAFVAMVRESRALGRRDRLILWASLSAYVVIGIIGVIHAHLAPTVPFAAGIGPALSHLVVGHERRLARMQAQQGMRELALSEARLRELVARAPIGIMSCDAAGEVRTVNPRMWQIFGAPQHVRRAPYGNMLHWERKRSAEGVPQLVHGALATGETQAGHVTFSPAWGGPKQLRVTATPLRDAAGAISGVLLLCEDDTERNELERRLRLAQKLEAVGQLAAGIAHEINTPMAYVRSNLRALREDWGALADELRKTTPSERAAGLLAGAEGLIDESLEGVERTIAVAGDMRQFAHSASGEREPTDLNHELETCVRLASTQRAGVRITESYAELPPVRASASQLRQVFLNLIVNALHAVSEHGSVAVSSARDGAFASVRVRDDGCGMPEHVQQRLFEPFFTTKPADQGTGLGLYISDQIVRAHGGEIRVASAPGAGSTFEVRIPLGES
jgi:PAS domain S-box-containing protein